MPSIVAPSTSFLQSHWTTTCCARTCVRSPIRMINFGVNSITRMRLKDVNLSANDFVTDSSTLEGSMQETVTVLNVDRAFAHGTTQTPTIHAVLFSRVEMAHTFNLDLLSEGVEN